MYDSRQPLESGAVVPNGMAPRGRTSPKRNMGMSTFEFLLTLA